MMALNMSNYWVIGGIALLVGEMLTGGFFLLFIALGAFAASLMAELAQPPVVQMLTCAAVSVIGVLTLRRPIQRRLLMKTVGVSSDVGKEIQVDADIPPHKNARITYQGTKWETTNVGREEVKAGDRVVIVGMNGILLLIRKVN